MTADDRLRGQMVDQDIAARGVRDPRVLDAMRKVPREAFVPAELRDAAFSDHPLPIGLRQTISQPYIVALMCEALQLRGNEHVLEIGTGSGYAAAVLGELAAEVETVERIAELASRAANQLAALGCTNVHVHIGDGTLGWPAAGPYHAIVVTAGGPSVPQALLDQLAPAGRLVMPVANSMGWQDLVRLTRLGADGFHRELLCDVAFVPLIGVEGWPER
ncbi:protein-L-isoaspartate(D-aspartate) O-methyltransferase [Piscinibacter sakaiensis]|uniref:protein-L-isoaspartate(D-aspartate) O-methyltransferase n=1 Tax=Piscinibacter sakaiensis TaxID=1547922 RepID=UPI003AAE906A